MILFLEYNHNERTISLKNFRECRKQSSRDALLNNALPNDFGF